MKTLRIIDANLNRLREGIRVIEDISRYALDDKILTLRLKYIRHLTQTQNSSLLNNLLLNRNIKCDIAKDSIQSEIKRENLKGIVIANFKRTQESARVVEEILKLDEVANILQFKNNAICIQNIESKNEIKNFDIATPYSRFKYIRYELYDIEISYFIALEKSNIL
ncbi:MAG: thiamine-phosphate pyrophosphorylase [Helicobacteraceae bacterium]|nr:thiamine-phosphate pyrophosphorylase [Helicobacteraceae bacterium]